MSCPVQTDDIEQRFLLSGYAAPEVVRAMEAGRGETEVGPESDMWSFGALVYECFTGELLAGVSDARPSDCVSLRQEALRTVDRTGWPCGCCDRWSNR